MENQKEKMRTVPFSRIELTPGFWYEKQKLVRTVSMWNVYRRFSETGRFDAFRFEWKEGQPNRPHIYWDSDVAKWIEAVAYLSQKQREPEMEAIVDEVVQFIQKNRMADGYYNSYFGHLAPEKRFTDRNAHELYCAGHLIEAAIAYRDATGKDLLFRLMKDYADLIYDVFYIRHAAAFQSPGHEEIELALVKLYRATKERKYLDLALFFINDRGQESGESNIQDHLPVREQTTAEGHAVRACYLYCAIADLALELNDRALRDTAERLFENIVNRRMYITGAVGQTCVGEAFMKDFDLPNQTAYAETCANLSLALFARRMSLLCPDSRYADTAERVLYNSFLSGMSLDGRAFFYSNLQENNLHVRRRQYSSRHTIFCPADQRVEVFSCSCCPPNVVRTIASIADFQYTTDGETIYCHQYLSSDAEIDGNRVRISTDYPFDGAVSLRYNGSPCRLALRIPGWCESYRLTVNGTPAEVQMETGYAVFRVSDGDEVSLLFDMPVRFAEADPRVWDDAGRIAVTRGPLVYCMEAVDNGNCLRDIRLDEHGEYTPVIDSASEIPVLETTGYRRIWADKRGLYAPPAPLAPCPVRLIPYFAFANRGESDMIIWTLKK